MLLVFFLWSIENRDFEMKVALISLGCSKNLVDAEIMLGVLKQAGFSISENADAAEVAIINTCAFIKEAKEEAIEAIFEVIRLKKEGRLKKVIVSGCLPQRYKNELSGLLKEVDGFLGPGNIDKIAEVIRASIRGEIPFLTAKAPYLYKPGSPRVSLTPKHYAYVKVADGCNNRCRYCVIPQIRGRYHSRAMESIVKEVQVLTAKGVKEVNLISQDTTFYGKDRYGEYKLAELLRRLVKIKKLRWIRIFYTHPRHFRRALIEVIAQEPKICKYIDLPIQHIDDKILKLMRRRVSSLQIKKLIDNLRSFIPGVALRTSLIVGFPRETEKNFRKLYKFVQDIQFERLGVFKYSREENTPAADLTPQVPEQIKERRLKKIMQLQQKIVENKNRTLIGKALDVLIDQVQGGNCSFGRTQFDGPEIDGVVVVKGRNIKAGSLITVKITASQGYDLIARKL